jgi:hypothetical protein
MTRGQGGHVRRYDMVGAAGTGRLGAEKEAEGEREQHDMVRWYAEPGTRRQRRGLDADLAHARQR